MNIDRGNKNNSDDAGVPYYDAELHKRVWQRFRHRLIWISAALIYVSVTVLLYLRVMEHLDHEGAGVVITVLFYAAPVVAMAGLTIAYSSYIDASVLETSDVRLHEVLETQSRYLSFFREHEEQALRALQAHLRALQAHPRAGAPRVHVVISKINDDLEESDESDESDESEESEDSAEKGPKDHFH